VKTIAVFSIFVSMVFGVFCTPLFAESGAADSAKAASRANPPKQAFGSYSLSVRPLFGMLWGEGEEQVYKDENSEALLSQLLWDMKPLWYGGTVVEFAQRDPLRHFGFFGALSVKFGVPMNTGVVEDRDWPKEGGALSNFSCHDNITQGAIMMDTALGISVPVRFLALRLSLGLSYMRFAWAAYDGYFRYGKNTGAGYEPLEDSDPAILASGAVLSYSQEWLFMPFGLSLVITPGRLFSGTLRCNVGPVFVFTGRDDHHLLTRTNQYAQFIDYMTGGLSLEPGGEFRFSPAERFSLALQFSWRSVTAKPHGMSLGRLTGSSGSTEWVSLGDSAGGLFQALDLGIGFEIRL
jgi:hypothetical protein